jgi:hypothetical protein
MMKFPPVFLCIVISAIAMTPSAYANQEILPSSIGDNNQAANLFTEPASIDGSWHFTTNPGDDSQQTTDSVLVVREPGCKKINPLDLINNPGAFFEQCQAATNEPIPHTGEPVDYLKVPRLDSGLNLTVTQF